MTQLSPAAQATLDELAAIVEPDGARLVVRDASASEVTIELDLSASECPECVLPRDLLVDILSYAAAGVGSRSPHGRAHRPREARP